MDFPGHPIQPVLSCWDDIAAQILSWLQTRQARLDGQYDPLVRQAVQWLELAS